MGIKYWLFLLVINASCTPVYYIFKPIDALYPEKALSDFSPKEQRKWLENEMVRECLDKCKAAAQIEESIVLANEWDDFDDTCLCQFRNKSIYIISRK